MLYKEKLAQANREARAAVFGLVLTIIVWAVAGFGVAQVDIAVFSTPLWVITGCVGTFVFAVLVAIVMAQGIFKDVNLDEIEPIVLDDGSDERGDVDVR